MPSFSCQIQQLALTLEVPPDSLCRPSPATDLVQGSPVPSSVTPRSPNCPSASCPHHSKSSLPKTHCAFPKGPPGHDLPLASGHRHGLGQLAGPSCQALPHPPLPPLHSAPQADSVTCPFPPWELILALCLHVTASVCPRPPSHTHPPLLPHQTPLL